VVAEKFSGEVNLLGMEKKCKTFPLYQGIFRQPLGQKQVPQLVLKDCILGQHTFD
jgi:hypothetical protein